MYWRIWLEANKKYSVELIFLGVGIALLTIPVWVYTDDLIVDTCVGHGEYDEPVDDRFVPIALSSCSHTQIVDVDEDSTGYSTGYVIMCAYTGGTFVN